MISTCSLEGLFSLRQLTTHRVNVVDGLSALVVIKNCLRFNFSVFIHFFPDTDGVFGRVPQSILDDEGSHLITAHENSLDLQNLHRVSENAYKQYLKSRPNPSAESIRRVKSTDVSSMAVHPLLGQFEEGAF